MSANINRKNLAAQINFPGQEGTDHAPDGVQP